MLEKVPAVHESRAICDQSKGLTNVCHLVIVFTYLLFFTSIINMITFFLSFLKMLSNVLIGTKHERLHPLFVERKPSPLEGTFQTSAYRTPS